MPMSKPVSWSDLHEAIQANPNRTTALGGGAVSASIASLPTEISIPWLPGWSADSDQSLDIVALSLWISDPLYRAATQGTKAVMEMEEAASLLHQHEKAYKEYTGHTWVRKHLEEELRARAAGAPAIPDFWSSVRTTKRAASLVDYVCRVRGFRVGLLYSEGVTNIPLISKEDLVLVYNNHVLVSSSGFRLSKTLWPDVTIKSDLPWFIPTCVPSVGTTTTAQILERLKALKPGVYKGNRLTLWRLLQMTLAFYSE
jgi:hypothetical protein